MCLRENLKKYIIFGGYCCYSFQSLLSPRLLSKNLKVKIYNYVITYVFDGCENVCLGLNKCTFKVLGDKLLRHMCIDESTGRASKILIFRLYMLKMIGQKYSVSHSLPNPAFL